ncbi:hypothetical protein ACJJTC_003366 [Scirpophaga incertulas]
MPAPKLRPVWELRGHAMNAFIEFVALTEATLKHTARTRGFVAAESDGAVATFNTSPTDPVVVVAKFRRVMLESRILAMTKTVAGGLLEGGTHHRVDKRCPWERQDGLGDFENGRDHRHSHNNNNRGGKRDADEARSQAGHKRQRPSTHLGIATSKWSQRGRKVICTYYIKYLEGDTIARMILDAGGTETKKIQNYTLKMAIQNNDAKTRDEILRNLRDPEAKSL